MDAPVLWLRGPLAAGALALTLAAGWAPAADKRAVTVEKTDYQGWKNNLRIFNGETELIVTLDVGPRVLSYKLAGGKNVFKEFPDSLGKTGGKDWVAYGGHRLWVGPEDLTRTYAPDNGPVKYRELDIGGVRFTPEPDTEYGVQREFDVTLSSTGSRVDVVQRIVNIGKAPTDLAPWALTMMAPGGVEVIPVPPKKPHPGPPANAKSPADYAPNQHLTLWPYFDFKDPRWSFGSKYITLRQDSKRGPTKIGLAHQLGWVGYLNGGTLFVKRFVYEDGKPYPDGGCNFETFSNQDFQEIETLGPLVKLAPGEKAELTEHWELHPDVKDFGDEAEIDANVWPQVKETKP